MGGLTSVFALAAMLAVGSGCDEAEGLETRARAAVAETADATLLCTADEDVPGQFTVECWQDAAAFGTGAPYLWATLIAPPDPPDDGDQGCYIGHEGSMEVMSFSHEIVSPRDALHGLMPPCEDPPPPDEDPSPPPPGQGPDGAGQGNPNGTGYYPYFLTDINYFN